MKKEEQCQRDWSKRQTRKSPPPVQNSIPYNNMEVRNDRYSPPEIRTHNNMSPYVYQNTYENFYHPMGGTLQQIEMKREREGYLSPYPPWNDNHTYPKKQYTSPYPGEFYSTQVDSNSLQSMAASITHNYDGRSNNNYRMSQELFNEGDDEELSRLNEKKKTHVLSDLIGGPVSISPQIYASPSPLISLSPPYFPYKNS